MPWGVQEEKYQVWLRNQACDTSSRCVYTVQLAKFRMFTPSTEPCFLGRGLRSPSIRPQPHWRDSQSWEEQRDRTGRFGCICDSRPCFGQLCRRGHWQVAVPRTSPGEKEKDCAVCRRVTVLYYYCNLLPVPMYYIYYCCLHSPSILYQIHDNNFCKTWLAKYSRGTVILYLTWRSVVGIKVGSDRGWEACTWTSARITHKMPPLLQNPICRTMEPVVIWR